MSKLSLLLSAMLLMNYFSAASVANRPTTYVLVHGAWHGAWCWHKVTPLLEAQGHRVIAIDLPSHGADKTPADQVSFDDYINKVVQVAKAQEGAVVLVGHSMGGVVIAQAAELLGTQKVASLVFLDAFMPKNGESVQMLAALAGENTAPKNPPIQAGFVLSESKKTATYNPELAKIIFYHDCSAEDVKFATARLSAQPLVALGSPVRVSDAVYGLIPKYYILCTQSKDLDKSPLVERVPIRKLYKLASSHSPFFSMPDQLSAILSNLPE